MQDNAIDLHALFQTIDRSLNVRCLAAQPLSGGSNNQLHRIEVRDGKPLLAKRYFPDDRRRLEREYGVLSALRSAGFSEVPQPLARFDALNLGLYSFVEGRSLPSSEFTPDHLSKIAAYLAKLHSVTRTEVKQEIPIGFMSAGSFAEVIALIRGRMSGFAGNKTAALLPSVQRFLKEVPVIELIESLLGTFISAHDHASLDQCLLESEQRLTSVDFGAHNMLWQADGSLVVLDFEYGGWDHPLRVIGDFLAHDQTRGLKPGDREHFVREYIRQSTLTSEQVEDLAAYRYLSELEWTMVLMTSLLPDKLARLAFAKGAAHDPEIFLQEQFLKIRERMERLSGYRV